jgi:PhnB protein
MTQADSPMAAQTPAGSEDLVLHARLQKGDLVLMASDYMANGEYPGKNGFSLSLVCDDVAEAKRIFSALAEGGEVTMEFGKTFWAEAFGMVRDKFGTPWMINGPTQPAPK